MNRILTILKCIKGIAGLIIAILIVVFVLNFLRNKTKPEFTPVPNGEDYRLIEDTYREPIISLPWQKDKAPIEEKRLPIPKKKVDKVIQIETPIPGSDKTSKTEIIIDKSGNVYKAIGTPEDTKIKVTKYQPKLIDFDLRFGYSLVISESMYHCLSVDYLRIWNFYLGSDFGLSQQGNSIGNDYLVGFSIKYSICEIGEYNKDNGVQLSFVAGFNLVKDMVYGGFNVRW